MIKGRISKNFEIHHAVENCEPYLSQKDSFLLVKLSKKIGREQEKLSNNQMERIVQGTFISDLFGNISLSNLDMI